LIINIAQQLKRYIYNLPPESSQALTAKKNKWATAACPRTIFVSGEVQVPKQCGKMPCQLLFSHTNVGLSVFPDHLVDKRTFR